MKQLIVAGILAFGLGHSAYAALGYELELTDGTNSALINSAGTLVLTGSASGTATANLALGVFTFNGTVGNYVVNVSTGEGSPLEPIGALDLNSVNTSGASAGPLKIEWSENGITATFPAWDMAWGGTLASGVGASVSNTAFQDNSNAFFGTMHPIGTIGPFGPGAFSGATTGSVAGVTAPYSLSEVINLSGVGATNYSGDSSLTPVPEPSAVALLGAALLLCSSRLRRRRA